MRIALIGDHNPNVAAHRAIPLALTLACEAGEHACEWEWVHTSTIRDEPSNQLAGFHGVWCVPASPYTNTKGALAAIRFARESRRAFLGTCGGFQHALLEYAEAEWGIADPAHAELSPDAADPIIAPLACSLVEESGDIHFAADSRLAAIYGTSTTTEEYHCRYGLSPRHGHRLADGPLRATGWDTAGDIRAIELQGHPFFIATLFQPERSALAGRTHPLVRAFVDAVKERAAIAAVLAHLKYGSGGWNHWRRENPGGVLSLDGVDLNGRILTGIDFSGVSLRDASLHAANLMSADLRGADLTGANLTEADLIAAKLQGATLSGAKLWEADLLGADLTGACYSDEDLKGALHVPPGPSG